MLGRIPITEHMSILFLFSLNKTNEIYTNHFSVNLHLRMISETIRWIIVVIAALFFCFFFHVHVDFPLIVALQGEKA